MPEIPLATQPKSKKSKRLLKILAILPILFLILFLCIPLLTSLFIPAVTSSLEQATGRKSSLQGLSLNLLTSKVFLHGLQIKEKDSDEDFLKLDKVEIDFSIWPAIFGKWELPKLEVSGFFLRIVREEKGNFNFQSLQDKMVTQKEPEKTEKPLKPVVVKETKPLALPKILAKILLNNINLIVEDKVEKSRLEIKNFCFSLDVDGFDKIQYNSSWEKGAFEAIKEKALSAGLLYKLDGKASMAIQDGKVVLNSKGELVFSEIYAKGFAEKDIALNPIRLSHDFSLDMLKGTVEGKASFTSDYFAAELVDLQISDLQKIQDQLASPLELQNKEKLHNFLSNLPVQNWKGKVEGWASLDKLREDFGDFIASASKQSIGSFGGKLNFSTVLEGKENSVLEYTQKGDISNLYVSGKMDSQKPYKVSLLQITKNVFASLDLKNRTFANSFDYKIQAKENSILASIKQKSRVEKLWESSPLEIKLFDWNLLVDLDVLNQVIADFIPEDTKLRGKIEHSDSLVFQQESGIKLLGSTNINAQVISPKQENLPGISIQGERDIEIMLDPQYRVKKVNMKKFGQQTKDSQLFQFSGKGEMDLESEKDQNLDLNFKIMLKELQPYLDVLAKGMKIQGNIDHRMRISKKADSVQLQAKGQLADFALAMEDSPNAFSVAVKEAKWGKNVSAQIREKQLSQLDVQKIFFHHPAMMVEMSGSLTKEPYQDSFKNKIQWKIDVPKIDIPGLLSLVNRKKRNVIEKIERVEKIQEKIKEVTENSPLATLSKEQREELKKLGLYLEISIQQIILNKANQIKDWNTLITLNHNVSDNQFALKSDGKTNSGSLSITGTGNLDQAHPEFQFSYDFNEVPYVVELFAPVGEKIQSIMPFPLMQKIQMDPAEVRFTVKGDSKWQGIDPRGIKKSLLGGKNTFKLSKGKLDLGLDLGKYMDTKNLEKEMESHIAPLNQTLSALKGQEDVQNSSINATQEKIKAIQSKVEDLEGKRKEASGIVEKLKPLAAWNPVTKSKLEEAQQRLDGYGKQIQDYRQQQSPLAQSIEQVKGKIADIQKKIQETQAKIQSAKEELMKKMKIDNPFAFEFDSFSLSFNMENEKPWQEQGTLSEWLPCSFSKINYVEIVFAPSDRNLLKITGWVSLDGKYHLSFMPPKESMEKLSSIPLLGKAIQDQGGIIMTSEGMKPNIK
ncbi:MAG: hypothetical protein HUU50_00790 [Candidatus Brocadiae bacterium]|nr:hypothetical protein [Candidatus Brocadiia bacterium]